MLVHAEIIGLTEIVFKINKDETEAEHRTAVPAVAQQLSG